MTPREAFGMIDRLVHTSAAFEFRLDTLQLLRLLRREIYIFSNVRRQIIADTKLS